MAEPIPGTPRSEKAGDDRLTSWKEIATYLKRDVTTVQRWEKREGMPVHRHLHDKMGSVYAFCTELDEWARTRNIRATQINGSDGLSDDTSTLSPDANAAIAPPETATQSRFALPQ